MTHQVEYTTDEEGRPVVPVHLIPLKHIVNTSERRLAAIEARLHLVEKQVAEMAAALDECRDESTAQTRRCTSPHDSEGHDYAERVDDVVCRRCGKHGVK